MDNVIIKSVVSIVNRLKIVMFIPFVYVCISVSKEYLSPDVNASEIGFISLGAHMASKLNIR